MSLLRRVPLAFLVALPSLCAAAPVDPTKLIDEAVARAWRDAKLAPPALADDATFLRRVSLDLVGVIPSEGEVRAFLSDKSPDKRARAVDQLLADPRYGSHFADYWEDVLLPAARKPQVDRAAFHRWMRARLDENLGWDQIVTRLVTATGVSSPGGKPFDLAAQADAPEATVDPTGEVNGAVDFLVAYDRDPRDLGGAIARELLGVQIQCAQCHHHPTEKWTQDDFGRFAAALSHLRARPIDKGMGMRRLRVDDAPKPVGGGPKMMNAEIKAIAQKSPAALDGTDLTGVGPEPRRKLAAWLTSTKNPWFGHELVNRYFAYLVGRGFVEPVDDLRPSNPAVQQPLFDALAEDFARHGFDLKRLVRALCLTRVYQRAATGGATRDGADPDGKLWTRYRLRPLAPRQLLDSIAAATDLGQLLAQVAPDRLERIRFQLAQAVGFVFDVDEEAATPDYEGTIAQALLLMNGALLSTGTSAVPASGLAQILAAPSSDGDRLAALYLRTLSRLPSPEETKQWLAFLDAPRALVRKAPPRPSPQNADGAANANAAAKKKGGRVTVPDPLRGMAARLRPVGETPREQAWEDVLWALLNSSEFQFRH